MFQKTTFAAYSLLAFSTIASACGPEREVCSVQRKPVAPKKVLCEAKGSFPKGTPEPLDVGLPCSDSFEDCRDLCLGTTSCISFKFDRSDTESPCTLWGKSLIANGFKRNKASTEIARYYNRRCFSFEECPQPVCPRGFNLRATGSGYDQIDESYLYAEHIDGDSEKNFRFRVGGRQTAGFQFRLDESSQLKYSGALSWFDTNGGADPQLFQLNQNAEEAEANPIKCSFVLDEEINEQTLQCSNNGGSYNKLVTENYDDPDNFIYLATPTEESGDYTPIKLVPSCPED